MSIEDTLKSLTKNEFTVLYWKSQGLKYEQIATQLDYSIDWVTLQMGNVYRKFGFKKDMHWTKRQEILEKEIYPKLPKNLEEWEFEVVPDRQTENVKEEPAQDPQITALVLYDENKFKKEKTEKPKKEPPIIVIQQGHLLPSPKPDPVVVILRLVIFLIVVIGVISSVGYFAYRFGRGSIIPPNQLITATFPPVIVTQTSDVVLPTQTDAIVYQTGVITAPPPLATFIPTLTSTPQISLPFYDNFEIGASPNWVSITSEGTWRVINGKYTETGERDFTWGYSLIGDTSWQNYSVDVDYSFENDIYAGAAVIVRASSRNNLGLAFVLENYDTSWRIWRDGQWQVLVEQSIGYSQKGHIRIEVNGSNYLGSIDGSGQIAITDSSFEAGNIGLGVNCRFKEACPLFDNISIEPISP